MAEDLNSLAEQADFHSQRQRLARRSALMLLLNLYRQAESQPLSYFPKIGKAQTEGRPVEPIWLGNKQSLGERNYSPGYARLLAGDRRFWVEPAAQAEVFRQTCRQLAELLSLKFLRPDDSERANR